MGPNQGVQNGSIRYSHAEGSVEQRSISIWHIILYTWLSSYNIVSMVTNLLFFKAFSFELVQKKTRLMLELYWFYWHQSKSKARPGALREPVNGQTSLYDAELLYIMATSYLYDAIWCQDPRSCLQLPYDDYASCKLNFGGHTFWGHTFWRKGIILGIFRYVPSANLLAAARIN